MALKNVILALPIDSAVVVQSTEGEWYTHCLIDEEYFDILDASGLTIWRDGSGEIPSELKSPDSGVLRHTFFGVEAQEEIPTSELPSPTSRVPL